MFMHLCRNTLELIPLNPLIQLVDYHNSRRTELIEEEIEIDSDYSRLPHLEAFLNTNSTVPNLFKLRHPFSIYK